MNWWRDSKIKIKFQELMKNHTTFKIGGPAAYFAEPKDTGELKLLLNHTKRYNIPVLVIGAGSNVLIKDRGVRAMVLRLRRIFFKKISFHNDCVSASSGVMLNQLIQFNRRHGLSGLEFLAGIPGTVGGALAMNAGITQKSKKLPKKSGSRQNVGKKPKIKGIADFVANVTVMDYNGVIKILHRKDLRFGYRKSNLSKYIILSALFKLKKKNQEEIKNRITRYMDYRKAAHELSRPSAGCVFKNPAGYSAGRLIDLCGLKGKRIGGACISQRHANFILNQGNARSSDVLALMNLIKKRVKKKFNVTLEPEIKIWK